MAAVSQSTRRKLSLLQLATELQNVSKACRLMGYHRDTFYEVRRAFQTGGVAALVEQRRGPRGPHPNRVAPEIEEQILGYALEHPTYGAQRVANQLRLAGVTVSAGAAFVASGSVTISKPASSGSCGSSGTPRRRRSSSPTSSCVCSNAIASTSAAGTSRPPAPANSSTRTPSIGAPSRAWARSTSRSSWTSSVPWPSPRSTRPSCR